MKPLVKALSWITGLVFLLSVGVAGFSLYRVLTPRQIGGLEHARLSAFSAASWVTIGSNEHPNVASAADFVRLTRDVKGASTVRLVALDRAGAPLWDDSVAVGDEDAVAPAAQPTCVPMPADLATLIRRPGYTKSMQARCGSNFIDQTVIVPRPLPTSGVAGWLVVTQTDARPFLDFRRHAIRLAIIGVASATLGALLIGWLGLRRHHFKTDVAGRSGAARVLGNLRTRIAGTVLLSVILACGALTLATVKWAEGQHSEQLATELSRLTFDQAVQWADIAQAHPGLVTGEQLVKAGFPGDRRSSSISANFAVAAVNNGQIDFSGLRPYAMVAGDRSIDSIPSNCFTIPADIISNLHIPSATSGWHLPCEGADLQFYLKTMSASSTVRAWVVIGLLETANYPSDGLALQKQLLSVSAIVIAVTAACAWVVAEFVEFPVREVREVAEKIADGDLSARVPTQRRGELGLMGQAVNSMANQLTTQIADLEGVNEVQRRFVSDVAHELRTPAAVLLASVTALESLSTRDAALAGIGPQSRRLAALTEDLLEVSRMDAGQAVVSASEFDVVDLVGEVVAGCGGPAAVVVQSRGAVVVRQDAVRVRVVVRNLIDNALRYGVAPVEVSVLALGGRVVVTVSDHGVGVPVGLRARVFDRFVQGDVSRHGDGSGLGLAIARGNARLLGGDLVLDADGRTFVFGLPLRWTPSDSVA